MLHCVHALHPLQPLLNVNLPMTIWLNVIPLTTVVAEVLQYPPIARMPLQLVGSVISLKGSLKTIRLAVQPAHAAGAVVPPSARIKFDVGTFVHAPNAESIAARE